MSQLQAVSPLIPSPNPPPFVFPFRVKFLFFDLFAGMSGLHVAMASHGILDTDGVAVIMFETDEHCRRILMKFVSFNSLLSPFEDSDSMAGSVFWLTDGGLESILSSLPDLLAVAFFAGSPCVGFSEAKKFSRGIDDPESAKMWSVPVLVARSKAHLSVSHPGRPVEVPFVLENVFI